MQEGKRRNRMREHTCLMKDKKKSDRGHGGWRMKVSMDGEKGDEEGRATENQEMRRN